MPAEEALRVCLEVARLFERLGVRYVVGGSLASSLHGVPRSTDDADLGAELREEHVRPLVEALEGRFYVDEERVRYAVRRGGSFNVIELSAMFKVDVFILGEGPLHREQLERRQRITLPEGGEELEVASAEDTVLQKLRWYRLGREVSERQWGDLVGVLKTQGRRLDWAYLERGAELL
ncbi:MAG TPA: hypothetical protein VNB06_06685, partial [Thermoanaerobaculia bacterium]|nr:hypothetical protein [Thermoanaerobaculia bacterium]